MVARKKQHKHVSRSPLQWVVDKASPKAWQRRIKNISECGSDVCSRNDAWASQTAREAVVEAARERRATESGPPQAARSGLTAAGGSKRRKRTRRQRP